MPDPARDPRQLARDILAGKISIEDLARQQAQRRAGGAPPRAPMPNRQVPMPGRPMAVPPPPPPRQAQPIRQVPFPTAPQRQAQPIQQVPFPTASRAQPIRKAPPVGPRIAAPTRPAQEPSLARRLEKQNTEAAAVTAATAATLAGNSLAALVASRDNVRRGMILAEVLGPPIALRDTL